jgi:hypothetical protein
MTRERLGLWWSPALFCGWPETDSEIFGRRFKYKKRPAIAREALLSFLSVLHV